jgi:hypothetical protein
VLGPCPDAPGCTVAGCDGSDLGHTLAVDFPAETARVDESLQGLVNRTLAVVHDEEHPAVLWADGSGRPGRAGCGHPSCVSHARQTPPDVSSSHD